MYVYAWKFAETISFWTCIRVVLVSNVGRRFKQPIIVVFLTPPSKFRGSTRLGLNRLLTDLF